MPTVALNAGASITADDAASLTIGKNIVAVASTVAVAVSATVGISEVRRSISASASISASVASAALALPGVRSLAARVESGVQPTSDLGLRRPLASALSAVASVRRSVLGIDVPLQSQPPAPWITAKVSKARLDPGRNTLGTCDVVADILTLWGIECINLAPSFAKRRALFDLNAAFQEVWNQAKDRNYWTRQTETIALAEGESSAALDDTIQNVIGPARLASNNQPLIPVGTRGEIDHVDDLYLDESDADEYPVTDPAFYFIERLYQAGNEPCKATLYVYPAAPAGGSSVKLDVVKEAPRFTQNDVDTCIPLPIPHKYVETLLLPIVRFRAMSYYLFIAADRAETIAAEYATAKAQLESADPIPGKTGEDAIRKEGGRP